MIYLGVVGSAMDDHVTSVVGQSKVVLGQGGLASVEGSLVTQGVGAVANSSGHVHNRAASIEL